MFFKDKQISYFVESSLSCVVLLYQFDRKREFLELSTAKKDDSRHTFINRILCQSSDPICQVRLTLRGETMEGLCWEISLEAAA